MARHVMTNRIAMICASAGLAASLTLATTPARALDDGKGNSFTDILGFFGMGDKPEDKVIHYRERAPLVLPPKTELRPPVPPAAQRTADWPQDQENIRALKASQDNKTRTMLETESDSSYAGKMTRVGRINPNEANEHAGPASDTAADCGRDPTMMKACNQESYWKTLSDAKKADDPSLKGLQAGVEPDRQYLTQPPKGYMGAKKSVKATFEPRDKEEQSIYDYYRPQPPEK